jgi:hypothetical protein
MAISKVVIANMALAHIGTKSNIQSFDEKSPEAKQCSLWYDFCLQQALEGFDWSFARTRKPLAVDGDAPPEQWGFRYQLPADCIATRRIWNPSGDDADAVPYELEINSNDVRTLLTDLDSAVLVYTRSVTNAAIFPPLFVELVSRGLAQHIAFSITGKLEIVKAQSDTYQSLLRSAPAYDANERVGKPPRDAEWIRGRSFNGYFDRKLAR